MTKVMSSRRPELWTAAFAFAVVTSVILWTSVGQPHGMIAGAVTFWVHYPQRLWPLCVVLLASFGLAWAFSWYAAAVPGLSASAGSDPWRRRTWLLITVAAFVTFLAVWVLRAFPNSSDEYDYLFQAQTFLRGRFWNPLPPGHHFFAFDYIAAKDGKLVAEYPPGRPALLAIAGLIHLPIWTVNPILGVGLLIVLARFCARETGWSSAWIAMALFALSPFFIFNAASYFTQVPSALFGLAFCYFASDFIDVPRFSTALIAGGALGAVGIIRPYDFIFFALPFAGELFLRGKAPHYARACGVVLGGLPFLIALGLYNRAITGNPLLLVAAWSTPQLASQFGLYPRDETGHVIPLSVPMRIAIANILELAEWTSPMLVLAYLPAIVWRIRRTNLRFYDLVFPTMMAAYVFFPIDAGNRYGPRYYFDAFPLMIVTMVSAIHGVLSRYPRNKLKLAGKGLITAHMITCIVAVMAISYSLRTVIDQRMDLYDQVARAGLHNAVVIVRSGTGTIRRMPAHDLIRNGLDLNGDVVYARDPGNKLAALRALFPSRRFYTYDRPVERVVGMLRPLE